MACKRFFCAMILFLSVLSLLVAEGDKEASDGAVLNLNLGGGEPRILDPGFSGASDEGHILNNLFEGLVREQEGKVIPGMAESWTVSDDGKLMVFKIRKGTKWSDGSPLTARDFVYSWKRAMDPATVSEYAWIWEYTNVIGALEVTKNEGSLDDVGVRAVDDYTLEVNLKSSTDYLVSLLAFYHFLPVKKSAVEAGPDGAWGKDPKIFVSNGPFKLVEYDIGDGLAMVKNENYWNADEVGIDRINVKFIKEASTAYAAFQAGEFDFLDADISVPISEVPRLIAENPEFYIFPLLGTYYYNFNMDLDMWQDVRVRRAMALAIDRGEIVEILSKGNISALAFVPPGFPDHNGEDFAATSGAYGMSENALVTEAQALLAEAGYPGGEGFPEFVLMYNTSDSHQQVAEIVQEMWSTNLGIKCTLENQEWATFQDTRFKGNYDVSRGGWLTDFLDPVGLLAIFASDNNYNDANYNNREYDELLVQANTSRGEEHFEALYAAQKVLMRDLPIIPVYYYVDSYLSKPKLKNWTRSQLGGLDFSHASIEE